MKKLLFATGNQSKINRFKKGLLENSIELLSLKDVDINIDIEENGTTAIENARIKARVYYDALGIPTMGMDDTLYLEGVPEDKQPGLYVRRVNGKTLTDEEMIKHYINLVKEYGKNGKLNCKWIYGLVVINEEGEENTYSWSKGNFYMVDEPSDKINPGYPLNSISKYNKIDKYFTEITEEDKEKLKTNEDDVIDFITKSLKQVINKRRGENMIKPKKLHKGDKVAIVSLSSGTAGEDLFRHRYELGKRRLEEEFGLITVTMPNALKGCEYLDNHPEARAKDLMDAFKDDTIKGIICNIGGNDTIRLLPYIDFELIKNNPKIFMGYSDATVNHFMMYKAGLTSYYGPCVMCEFAENKEMHEYTKKYVEEVLFENKENIKITSSSKWTSEFLDWCVEENDNIPRKMQEEEHGYEVLQGTGSFEGELLGGCLDVFPMFIGTKIWPTLDEWKDKILFLETSEEEPTPDFVRYALLNLAAIGILDVIKGIIVGKPKNEAYYEEYKEVYKKVVGEVNPDLPILYNINIGHADPMCIFPLGLKVKVDMDKKEITFSEKPTQD